MKSHFGIFQILYYWNHTSTWVFLCKFAAYFQNTFFEEHLSMAASESSSTRFQYIIEYLYTQLVIGLK